MLIAFLLWKLNTSKTLTATGTAAWKGKQSSPATVHSNHWYQNLLGWGVST